MTYFILKEQFKDIKGLIRSRNLNNRQYNGQKKKCKKWSTKYYIEN